VARSPARLRFLRRARCHPCQRVLGSSPTIYTRDFGGLRAGAIAVVAIDIPASQSATSWGRLQWAEYVDPRGTRQVTLSRSACDFRSVDSTGNNGPLVATGGASGDVYWNLGTPRSGYPEGHVIAGQRYYVNLRPEQRLRPPAACATWCSAWAGTSRGSARGGRPAHRALVVPAPAARFPAWPARIPIGTRHPISPPIRVTTCASLPVKRDQPHSCNTMRRAAGKRLRIHTQQESQS
jgi:hypothetical protein